MAEINKPDLTNNWGSLGGVLEPDSTKIGLGWQEGESPLCEWQNWWQNRADASLSYLYQKGVPEWDASTEYIANKSIVNYQGNLYLCTTTNTNNLPTNASFWKRTGLALSDIPSASTSVKGIVQLNDTLSSTSTSLALTAKQGKALNDNKVSTTTTVNGKALSGNISLTKTDVGLGNVDDVKQLPDSYLDTSGTLASESDVKVPSQKAVKTYADTKVPKTTTVNSKPLSTDVVLNKTDIGLGSVDNTQQLPMSYLDVSTTLADNSDTKVPSQKAVKAYADSKLSKASNLSDVANTATARTNLGLTSAATTAVTANNLDTTSGRLLKVGDFGVGVQINIPDAVDLNDYKTPGNYGQPSATYATNGTNYPIPHAGVLIVEKSGANTTGVSQRYTRYDSSESYTRAYNGTSWSAWDRTVTEAMTGTAYTRNYTTSTTLAANSDSNVPTEKAVRTYVDTKVGETPFRNRIMNGDFLVNQRRGTTALTLTATGQYNSDRWQHSASQSSKASSQVVSGGSTVGSKNYLRMKTVSAITIGSADSFSIAQSIEGINVQDFNFGTASATQITLSFWVRASQTGTYNVAFRNAASNRSYVTTYTISAANAWEYKTTTINGDTSGTWKNDTDTGLSVRFDFGSGSTYTTSSTNTWLAGNFVKSSGTKSLITTLNATLDITLVQLEKGGVATPFEYLPFSDSLARCERYYQKCYANTRGYAPGSGYTIETPIQFRTQMRVIPTTSLIGGTRSNVSSVLVSNALSFGARHELLSIGAGDTIAIGEIAIFDAEL